MYVSNLGFHVTEEDLRKLFEQFGQVSSAKLILDKETGRGRRFGFVEMASEAEASLAMSKLDKKEIEGRLMSVTIAKGKSPRADNKRW